MKHNIEAETPHLPGLDLPAVLVDGAAISIRGSTYRLALCEGLQVRGAFAMQIIDAVRMAEDILAARNQMLQETMERAGEGPKSAIHRQN